MCCCGSGIEGKDILMVSVTMAGFIAAYFAFRYQALNQYADNRKEVLRKLAEIKFRGKKNQSLYADALLRIQHSMKGFGTSLNWNGPEGAVSQSLEKQIQEIRHARGRLFWCSMFMISLWLGYGIAAVLLKNLHILIHEITLSAYFVLSIVFFFCTARLEKIE